MSPQVLVFFQSCLLGACLGMLYDAFRILRLAFPNGKLLVFLEDVLYCLAVSLVSFVFIVLMNDGILRAFLLLGELLGAILYFFSVSVLIMKMAKLILKIIQSILLFIYRITLRPMIHFIRWIFRKMGKLFRCLWQKFKIILLKPKNHLKPSLDIVYNENNVTNTQAKFEDSKKQGGFRWLKRKRKSC